MNRASETVPQQRSKRKKNVTVFKQAPDVHFSDFNSTKYMYNFLKVWFTLTEINSQHKF